MYVSSNQIFIVVRKHIFAINPKSEYLLFVNFNFFFFFCIYIYIYAYNIHIIIIIFHIGTTNLFSKIKKKEVIEMLEKIRINKNVYQQRLSLFFYVESTRLFIVFDRLNKFVL